MRCLNCDHLNPEENRFCGMCGNMLVPAPSSAPNYSANKLERAADQDRIKVPANLHWEPAVPPPLQEPSATSPEPVDIPWYESEKTEPVAEAPESPRPRYGNKTEPVEQSPEPQTPRNGKWWVEEPTVGGPSFLGLNSLESGSSGGYSYLFDEPKRSHTGLWVMLVILLVAGGVLYLKWQPIRDYVLTTAFSHSRAKQQPPAQEASNPSPPESSGPTTTLATSDAPSQPAITTEQKDNTAAQPAAPKQGAAQPAASSAPPAKPDAAAATPGAAPPSAAAEPASKHPTAKGAEPSRVDAAAAEQDEEETTAAKPERASTEKRTRAAQSPEGGELVASGEKYLYGRGVPRSCDQAVSYFNAAAAKQNSQAFSHLGALYATGECVPMDRAKAYAWFRRAYSKEPSNHYFEQNLTMLWREMTPDERQRATRR